MKKLILFIVFILILLLTTNCTTNNITELQVVEFNDKVLEDSIKFILSKDEDDKIYKSELTTLKYLVMIDTVTDLTELKYCIELRVLLIPDGNPVNFSVLENLSNIEDLEIGNCEYVEDLSIINKLNKLKFLRINNSSIKKLYPLENLSNIESIDLRKNNELIDISGIEAISNITRLILYENFNITNIDYIKQLYNIEKLWIVENLVNIEFIENLSNLQQVNFMNNKIRDLNPILELYNNGGLQKNNPYIEIEYNNMDIRPGSKNREIVDFLIEKGIDIDWKRGNITE